MEKKEDERRERRRERTLSEREKFFSQTTDSAPVNVQAKWDEKLSNYRRISVGPQIPQEGEFRKRSSSFGSNLPVLIPTRTNPRGGVMGWTNSAESVANLTSKPSRASPLPRQRTITSPSVAGKPQDAMPTKTASSKPTLSTIPSRVAVTETDNKIAASIITNTKIDDPNYKMDHKSRGRVIILNHKKFDDQQDRLGTEVDINRLNNSLPKLGFKKNDIEIYNDYSYSKIEALLDRVSRDDHTNCDLFMLIVMTHGNKDDRIYAYDLDYATQKLWKPFTAEKCTSLAGKPKIFIIVACRGTQVDSGVKMASRAGRRKMSLNTEVDSSALNQFSNYSIPVWADFLTIYSTVNGFYSYREPENGTWYIESLCQEIDHADYTQPQHFLDLLTRVNRRVAINHETVHDKQEANKKKQCPFITSTLTRRIYIS